MSQPRDVFPLRFKNPHTREALKYMSKQTGMPMTDIAERAIEHEVAMLGTDLERRLTEALEAVRSYQVALDAQSYVAEFAAGEGSGLDPFRGMQGTHTSQDSIQTRPQQTDPLGVLAAFAR